MHPTQIKQALYQQGINLTMFAQGTGYSKGMISGVVNKKHKSFTIAEKIAKAIDKDLFEVFPEYKDSVPRVKNTKEHRQKAMEKLQSL